MKTLLRECTWLSMVPFGHGWGNGYVLLPKGHPYHGKDYDDIPVSVHGGLTYAQEVTETHLESYPSLDKEDIGCWMVGFDTCHTGDTQRKCSYFYVKKQTQSLKQQLEELS